MADHYDEQREKFGYDRTLGRAEVKQKEQTQTVSDAVKQCHDALTKMGESAVKAYEGSMQKEHKTDDRDFNHYYINVSKYDYIDIYRVTDLYGASSAEHHAVKKILCSGKRGAKGKIKDLKEAKASIERQIEMLEEDE